MYAIFQTYFGQTCQQPFTYDFCCKIQYPFFEQKAGYFCGFVLTTFRSQLAEVQRKGKYIL